MSAREVEAVLARSGVWCGRPDCGQRRGAACSYCAGHHEYVADQLRAWLLAPEQVERGCQSRWPTFDEAGGDTQAEMRRIVRDTLTAALGGGDDE